MAAALLKRIGKMTSAVLATIMAPQVGRDDMVEAIGYIENAGAPTAVTPDFIGQWLFDTTNLIFYRATAITAGAWAIVSEGVNPAGGFFTQGAPAAKTVAVQLTAAELLGRLITANQGGAAAANYQLPLGTDLEAALVAAFPNLAVGTSFDFTLNNISTVAAEDITITTAAGWTLVGGMVVNSNDAGTSISTGTFRVRRTAASNFVLYRL